MMLGLFCNRQHNISDDDDCGMMLDLFWHDFVAPLDANCNSTALVHQAHNEKTIFLPMT